MFWVGYVRAVVTDNINTVTIRVYSIQVTNVSCSVIITVNLKWIIVIRTVITAIP